MNLIETFSEFKAGKNIDRPTMVRVLEDVFRTLIKKKYGSDDNFDVMRGYVKLGISVLHEDDDPVDLAIKESVSEKDKDLNEIEELDYIIDIPESMRRYIDLDE